MKNGNNNRSWNISDLVYLQLSLLSVMSSLSVTFKYLAVSIMALIAPLSSFPEKMNLFLRKYSYFYY